MIRRMAEADIPAVAELERQCFSDFWSEKLLRESMERPEYIFLAEEEQGRLIGYGILLLNYDEGDILKIAVGEAYRGRGYGRALAEDLMDEGRRQGFCAFTLEVRAGNAPAIHLYESLGFRSAGVRKDFYERPTEDALIMWQQEPDN